MTQDNEKFGGTGSTTGTTGSTGSTTTGTTGSTTRAVTDDNRGATTGGSTSTTTGSGFQATGNSGSYQSQDRGRDFDSYDRGGDYMVESQRSSPSTATVIGAALAGAFAGAAIPFMFSGRKTQQFYPTNPRGRGDLHLDERGDVDFDKGSRSPDKHRL